MKKLHPIAWYDYILVVVLFILGLAFIYPFTVSGFSGDSNQYFSWIKDIYTHHGGYFSWTTAAGYNQFSIIHLFSLALGSVTYKSPVAFFMVVNYSELILLAFAGCIFIKLVNFNSHTAQLTKWVYGLPFFIVYWTLVCLFAGGTAPQSVPLQATDLFLIFVDSFIVISIGWFLFLIHRIFIIKDTPKLNLICFILFSLYFSLTTLRFLSGAVFTEAILLICILIRSKWIVKCGSNIKSMDKNPKPSNKGNNISATKISKSEVDKPDVLWYVPFSKKSVAVLIGLGIIFMLGYYGFFMIEPYSSSARFVLRGSETSTAQAWNNACVALGQYVAFTDLNLLNIFLRLSYFIILCYGIVILLHVAILPKKSARLNLDYTQIFGLLTAINFILVTATGLFSHGTVFLDTGVIAHYYELSAIFAFFTFTAFILNKCEKINSIGIGLNRIKYISLMGLFISIIFSGFYIKAKSNTEFPNSKLLSCINANKNKYQLKNGMGDFWAVNPLMAQTTDTRFSVIGSMATNLDYNWQRNLTESMTNTNFLVYTNSEYKQNILNLISSKIPTLNYQEINCSNYVRVGDAGINDTGINDTGISDTGIIVFDTQTANYIDQFRNREFNNSKAWFFISNYGTGQRLWAKMPWNQRFIESYHEYSYFASLLRRTSPQAQYTVNGNFFMQVDAKDLSQTQAVLMTEMIHAGAGNYSVKLSYELTGDQAGVFVINLGTQQPIANLTLQQSETNEQLDFNLNNTTPIAIIIVMAPGSKLLFKQLNLNKFVTYP